MEIGTGIILDLDFCEVADKRDVGDHHCYIFRLEIAGSVEDLLSVALDIVARVDRDRLVIDDIRIGVRAFRASRCAVGATIYTALIGVGVNSVELDALPVSRLAILSRQCVEDGVFTGSSGQGNQFIKLRKKMNIDNINKKSISNQKLIYLIN